MVRSVIVDVGPCCDSDNMSQTSSMNVSHREACYIVFVICATSFFPQAKWGIDQGITLMTRI